MTLRNVVFVCSFFCLIGGSISFFINVTRLDSTGKFGIAPSLVIIATGVAGLFSTRRRSVSYARAYFWGIISYIVVSIIINIVGIVFSQKWASDYCRQYPTNNSFTVQNCEETFRYSAIISFGIGTVISVLLCSGFAIVAWKYVRELQMTGGITEYDRILYNPPPPSAFPHQHAFEEPAYGQPAVNYNTHAPQPSYGQPIHNHPAYGQPAYGQPTLGATPPAEGRY
eukprot:TRINITY_DN892_c0_g1_i1.p1 TRINITY_DN892_c0_g1~~TRINITY_DN892_c0_g1_i1.p1  ORF type:complete len:226 (+),score=43.39 TRINITY_DN892_c0_g1_i1:773-1450(+)